MQLKTALLSAAVVAALAGLAIHGARSSDAAAASGTGARAVAAADRSAGAATPAARTATAQAAPASPGAAALSALIDAGARPGSRQAWASGSPEQADRTSAAARARELLATAAAREVNLARADGFNARDVMIDCDGTEHVRMERSYQGLPVIGGDMVVHSRDGQLLSVTQGANMRTTARPGLTPGISADRARAEASANFDGRVAETAPAKLVVYARNGMEPTLAYQVDLNGERNNDAAPGVFSYFLDAGNGALLEAEDRVETAAATGSARTLTLGQVGITTDSTATGYVLTDPTRGNNQTRDANHGGDPLTGSLPSNHTAFSDADNAWGDGTTAHRATAAADAHYGVAAAWDYYKTVHGRAGLKNDGKGIVSYVHYAKDYFNAAFVKPFFGQGYMIYGDGNERNGYRPLVALDVAAHEMGHGLNFATANLGYYGIKDSGGVNEGSSDIFGMLVEYSTNNASDPGDWLIGEKLYDGTDPNKALRRMFDQASDGRSFNCYPVGGFTAEDTKPIVVDGVRKGGKYDPHLTSGVANRFAYLLSEGAVAPPNFPEYTPDRLVCNGDTGIAGIGRAKLGAIWYRALTKYFVSSTDFPGARKGTLQAAADLYGAGSTEYQTVARAWSAVKVD